MRFYHNDNEILNEEQFELKLQESIKKEFPENRLEILINNAINNGCSSDELSKLYIHDSYIVEKIITDTVREIIEQIIKEKIETYKREFREQYISFDIDFETGAVKHIKNNY